VDAKQKLKLALTQIQAGCNAFERAGGKVSITQMHDHGKNPVAIILEGVEIVKDNDGKGKLCIKV